MIRQVLVLALLIIAQSPAIGKNSTRRLAVLVSANDGGRDRVRLRYANSDADAFARVLRTMGGVGKNDSFILRDASVNDFKKSVESIKRRILRHASQGERIELVFYYSGHSDESGLLMEDGQIPYSDLKRMINNLPADVRIMILDSCASGSLTLTKGGRRRPAFLLDSSSTTKGHAIITSASATEAAQESDRIRGSFFTHYFLTGLRGAADANRDRRVTLNEAYQFAYHSTLARTETTRSGPQHPSYDFHLAGTGDLTLTDLRASTATLSFSKNLSGRYFIRNDDGELVAEINKTQGRPIDLGIEPGTYSIVRSDEAGYKQSKVLIKRGASISAEQLLWTKVDGEPAVARGVAAPTVYAPKSYSLQLVPDFGDQAPASREDHGFALGFLGGRSGKISGMSLALVGYQVDAGGVEGAMVSIFINNNLGNLHGAQFTAGLNLTHGTVVGALGNYVGESIIGAQMAALGNYSHGGIHGAQLAGWGNFAVESIRGAQLAGLANVALSGVTGVQAAVGNYSHSIAGVQAGFVNYANSVQGLQVGFANASQYVEGMQLGLVNYAQIDSGFSLGLVTYSGNGTMDIQTWGDELGFTHGTFKMGSRYLYTIYDVAGRGKDGERVHTTGGIGLGTHILFYDFDFALESILTSTFRDDENGSQHDFIRTQGTLGYNLIDRIYVYVGVGYNAYSSNEAEFRRALGPEFSGKVWANDHTTRWLGRLVGVRYKIRR